MRVAVGRGQTFLNRQASLVVAKDGTDLWSAAWRLEARFVQDFNIRSSLVNGMISSLNMPFLESIHHLLRLSP